PLAATLTSERVYGAFYDDYETLRAFLHSHSYTGNPLGCRAALASLDIFEQDDVCARNRELSRTMAEATAPLADHPHVGEVRQRGMILAIEMVRDRATREPYPWQERRGLRVYRHALTRGVLLRPLGNVIYFMPPYVITPDQIRFLAEVAAEGIDMATHE
ncbi:MAG: aminotransferase class III-fold pyridoxal phosphate-dependent enzyme, partial [Gammaproteobacteria bacterium]|nr:aminotransferase class III-fold pyridoxal phosphate-dependent enzyme [Gammaproteobacteria bacterium]